MKTEILTIRNADDTETIKKAANLLDQGCLVAFPTETVYGIGCSVKPEALQRLNAIKGRHPDKHYTLHVGSHEQISNYVPSMNLRAAKLIRNGLPGPMTVVFDLNSQALEQMRKVYSPELPELLCKDGTLGIRYPDNPVADAILSMTQSPVVAPSANPAEQPPATTAAEVVDYFNGQVDCIIDAPASGCLYKKSSTVVKVGGRGIEILRPGAVSAGQIQKWTVVCVLFVCTGNTCRSPMAEGCCKKYFSDILGCQVDELVDLGYIIRSAGVAAFENSPASENALRVCQEHGIELRGHRSHQLTPEDIKQTDLIFTMSRSHRLYINHLLPSAAEKCFRLNVDSDISDPVGMDDVAYRDCFHQIKDNVINALNGII